MTGAPAVGIARRSDLDDVEEVGTCPTLGIPITEDAAGIARHANGTRCLGPDGEPIGIAPVVTETFAMLGSLNHLAKVEPEPIVLWAIFRRCDGSTRMVGCVHKNGEVLPVDTAPDDRRANFLGYQVSRWES